MITKGAEALIIASIDGTTLSQVLQTAADADIPVIAYDRLIRDTRERRLLRDVRQLPRRPAAGGPLLNGLGLTDLEGNAAR